MRTAAQRLYLAIALAVALPFTMGADGGCFDGGRAYYDTHVPKWQDGTMGTTGASCEQIMRGVVSNGWNRCYDTSDEVWGCVVSCRQNGGAGGQWSCEDICRGQCYYRLYDAVTGHRDPIHYPNPLHAKLMDCLQDNGCVMAYPYISGVHYGDGYMAMAPIDPACYFTHTAKTTGACYVQAYDCSPEIVGNAEGLDPVALEERVPSEGTLAMSVE